MVKEGRPNLERAVLGKALTSGLTATDIRETLDPELFSVGRHKTIAKGILDMAKSGEDPDAVSLMDKLESSGAVTSSTLVIEICNGNEAVLKSGSYFECMDELAGVKSEEISQGLISKILNTKTLSGTERLEKIQEILSSGKRDDSGDEFLTVKDGMPIWFTEVEKVYNDEITFTPFSVNKVELGINLKAGDLVCLSGTPATGKTAFALNFALSCSEAGESVDIYSLEMTKLQVISRLVQSVGKVRDALRYKLDEFDWPSVTSAVKTLNERRISVFDSSPLDISRLMTLVHKRKKTKVIIVDYLQLLRSRDYKDEYQSITHISKTLKEIANRSEKIVIVLSQLNRDSSKVGRKPRNSDLRGSGSIEQDSDVIVHLYSDPDRKDIVEAIIGKNRHGSAGFSVPLFFDKPNQFFRHPLPEEMMKEEKNNSYSNPHR